MTPQPLRDRPRYVAARRNDDGTLRWYWLPSPALRRAGWKMLVLGHDRAEAFRAGLARNDQVDAWEAAGRPSLESTAGARRTRAPAAIGTVAQLVDAYRGHRSYLRLADKTRRDYGRQLDYLEDWIGDVPVRAVSEKMVEDRYTARMARTPRQAAMWVAVCRAAFNSARKCFEPHHPCYVKRADNPFASIGVEGGVRREAELWTPADLVDIAVAAGELGWPSIGAYVHLGYWLGQREGDLLRLPRQVAGDRTVTIEQNKTRKRVHLAAHMVAELRTIMQAQVERQDAARPAGRPVPTTLLVNERTHATWLSDTFRHAFAEVRARAAARRLELAIGTVDEATAAAALEHGRRLLRLQAMWLRHTAITVMLGLGMSEPEIALISGHSLATVRTIADRHYWVREAAAAEQAMAKRVAGSVVRLEPK